MILPKEGFRIEPAQQSVLYFSPERGQNWMVFYNQLRFQPELIIYFGMWTLEKKRIYRPSLCRFHCRRSALVAESKMWSPSRESQSGNRCKTARKQSPTICKRRVIAFVAQIGSFCWTWQMGAERENVNNECKWKAIYERMYKLGEVFSDQSGNNPKR